MNASRFQGWVQSLASARSRVELRDRVAATLGTLMDVSASGMVFYPAVGVPTHVDSTSEHGAPPWLLPAVFAFGVENDPIARAMRTDHIAVHDGMVFERHEWERQRIFVELARPSGLENYLLAPLLSAGRVRAVLVLARTRAYPRFSDRDAMRAQAAASHLVSLLLDIERTQDRRRRARGPRQTPSGLALLDRHGELVELVARGLTNQQIAMVLGKSPHTVRHQLELLFARLEVASRAELAALWMRHVNDDSGES